MPPKPKMIMSTSSILTILLVDVGGKLGATSVTDVCVALHGGVAQPGKRDGFWNVLMAATASSMFV